MATHVVTETHILIHTLSDIYLDRLIGFVVGAASVAGLILVVFTARLASRPLTCNRLLTGLRLLGTKS